MSFREWEFRGAFHSDVHNVRHPRLAWEGGDAEYDDADNGLSPFWQQRRPQWHLSAAHGWKLYSVPRTPRQQERPSAPSPARLSPHLPGSVPPPKSGRRASGGGFGGGVRGGTRNASSAAPTCRSATPLQRRAWELKQELGRHAAGATQMGWGTIAAQSVPSSPDPMSSWDF